MKRFLFLAFLVVVSCSENDCVEDCSGVCGGTAVLDECGICDGNNACLELKQCDLSPSDFIDLMTLTGKIDILSEEQSTSDTLFAFFEESCRGKTTPMLENDNYICYLAIYGNSHNDEIVDFYYFQSSTNIFWKLDQSVLFVNGQILGNPSAPFIFTNEGVQE